MNNFLKQTLIFQNIFGINESFDFITGRDFFAKPLSTPRDNHITPRQTNCNIQTANNQVINKTAHLDQMTEQKTTSSENQTAHQENNKEPNYNIDLSNIKDFDSLIIAIKEFNGCSLKRHATNDVIFDGNKNAKIMLIGEAPGENEDLEGKPFCGQSGKLLRKALSCINLTTENMLITNTVYWRPPDNRKPYQDEISTCLPFLKKMINLVKPQIVILCGATAIETILGTKQKMSEITGKIQSIQINLNNQPETAIETTELKCFPIYHPSYLLRVPSMKKTFWKHLLILKDIIDKVH